MAFIDEITIHAAAGRGGDGVVRWRRGKYRPKMGPGGGDGGRGGNVCFTAVRDISALGRFDAHRSYRAEDGAHGSSDGKEGRNGDDLVLEVPVGSIIDVEETEERWELLAEGERACVLKGGKGGLGNERFASSTNQTPQQATDGRPGGESTIRLTLQLIADVGLVGLPNAGKSSLLNELTRARARVGDYPFTTLDPNLGVLPSGHVVADIPGLIEGAHEGKGLGDRFLRHISRTKLLAHCISLERDSPSEDYAVVERELGAYAGLAEKRQIVILTKSDAVERKHAESVQKDFEARGHEVCVVSILEPDTVKACGDLLTGALRQAEMGATRGT